MQILPQWVKDLVSHQPDIFDATFRRSFPPQATDINFPDLDPSVRLGPSTLTLVIFETYGQKRFIWMLTILECGTIIECSASQVW